MFTGVGLVSGKGCIVFPLVIKYEMLSWLTVDFAIRVLSLGISSENTVV